MSQYTREWQKNRDPNNVKYSMCKEEQKKEAASLLTVSLVFLIKRSRRQSDHTSVGHSCLLPQGLPGSWGHAVQRSPEPCRHHRPVQDVHKHGPSSSWTRKLLLKNPQCQLVGLLWKVCACSLKAVNANPSLSWSFLSHALGLEPVRPLLCREPWGEVGEQCSPACRPELGLCFSSDPRSSLPGPVHAVTL